MSNIKLTLNDRCDSCGAPAAAVVSLSNGSKLFMCNHHTNKHFEALQADGATIIRMNEDD